MATTRTIRATPSSAVTSGTYRIVLKEDAFGTDKPSADVAAGSIAVGAATTTYSATWGTPTYADSTRAITAVLTLSEDPGSAFDVSQDFDVQVRSGTAGSYTWTNASNWSFSSQGTTTSRTITATPTNAVAAGVYRLVLDEDAFGTGKPNTDVETIGVDVSAVPTPYSASWGVPGYTASTRAINAVLTLSEDPGSSFDVAQDFKVEVRSGMPGSYTWADSSNWSFSSQGTTTSRTITATPGNTVAAGNYRLVAKEDAFGTDKPNADVESTGVAVAAIVIQYVTITIGQATVNSTDRTITWPITVSDSILMGLDGSDVINRAPSAVMLSISGSGTSYSLTMSGFAAGSSGTAGFSIRANAFNTNSLPANHRNNQEVSAPNKEYNFGTTSYSAVWCEPIFDNVRDDLTAIITLSEEPGSTFCIGDDFQIERRSGSPGSYTWARDTAWNLSLGREPTFGNIGREYTRLTEGVAYDRFIPVSGNPVPNYSSAVVEGVLPDGMTLGRGALAIVLSGTPTNIPDEGVNFSIRYNAANVIGIATTTVSYHVASAS